MHIIGQNKRTFGRHFVDRLQRNRPLIGDGRAHQNFMGLGIDQAGSTHANGQRLIVHHLFQHAGGRHDHVLRTRHLAANFLADQVAIEIQPADFDRALGNKNADNMPPLRIKLKRNPGPPPARRFSAAFPQQSLLKQAADHIANPIGRLPRPLMKFPTAKASLVPQDLDDFLFTLV